ncbi:hypothetical protein KKJFFJLC_00020 [Vibrio phage vB_VpaS_PGB]|nr:hypothetical protein HHKILHMN_00014 [Vibrio phage vB_VpaS_PGA]WVH05563.1 hypothetical protein KKJFFJLC_00020 [Vibrio phage vB_VpaS_PGB]
MGAHMENKIKIQFEGAGDRNSLEIEGVAKIEQDGEVYRYEGLLTTSNPGEQLKEILNIRTQLLEHVKSGGE